MNITSEIKDSLLLNSRPWHCGGPIQDAFLVLPNHSFHFHSGFGWSNIFMAVRVTVPSDKIPKCDGNGRLQRQRQRHHMHWITLDRPHAPRQFDTVSLIALRIWSQLDKVLLHRSQFLNHKFQWFHLYWSLSTTINCLGPFYQQLSPRVSLVLTHWAKQVLAGCELIE